MLAYEAGYRRQFRERLSLDIAAYVNRYDDLRTQELRPGQPILLANMMNALSRGLESTRVGAARALVADARLARVPLEGAHVRSRQHGSDAGHVGSQRSAQHLQTALVYQRHQAHRDRRVLPMRTARCRSRPSMPTRSSTRGSATAIRPGWDLSLIGTNLLHDRHVEFRAGTAPETYERSVSAAFGMALLISARVRRSLATAGRVRCWLAPTAVGASARRRSKPTSRPCSSSTSAKYVTWPPIAIGERSPAEFRICVTADDAFFALLKSAVQGEDIDGKPLLPVALDGLDEAKTCQILYVGDSQTPDAKAWLAAVRTSQVLTVADGALTDDTVIAFVRDDNRIRFDINRAAAARRGLNVSSKLLRLARQVRDR